MFSSSSHIRKLIPETKTGISTKDRKYIHDKHKYVFFLLGMSIYGNTDTSLLTQKLFHCENFANDCNLYYNACITMFSLTYFIVLTLDFRALLASIWFLLLCHTLHILAGFFGSGLKARNLFIVVFALLGIGRATVMFSSSHVISKIFFSSAQVLLNNGRSGFQLVSGIFQAALNNIIGFNTIFQCRLKLILCHSLQCLITFFCCVWITILYLNYNDKVERETYDFSNISNISEKFKKFKYLHYFITRFLLYHIGSFKYLFHTGLIPFLLEIPSTSKLIGSIIYTFCEFVGRSSSLSIDETIFTKSAGESTALFFVARDIHLFVVIFSVITLNLVILYSAFTGNLAISRTPSNIFVSLGVSGFIYGYTITRATTGSHAIMSYYRKIPKNGIPDDPKIVTDILTITYNCSLIIPYACSKVLQGVLRRSRISREYILTRKYGNLSPSDLDTLLALSTKN